MSNKLFGIILACLVFFSVAAFNVSCSGDNASSDGDGADGDYAGYEPIKGPDGYIECRSDEDCWNAGLQASARCVEKDGFMVCALPTEGACEDICNPLCCYCQGDDCICTGCKSDGDSDNNISDGPIPSAPGNVDMGAVVMNGSATKTFEICNDGAARLYLIGDPLINPVEGPEGNRGDVSEFSFAGDLPSDGNKLELDFLDCATVEVTYKPSNPGRDFVDFIVSSNADTGLIKVHIISQLKGTQKLQVTCDTEIEDENGQKCCLAPSTLVQQMGVLELTLKNKPKETDSNATLVITEIFLESADPIYDIDRGSVGYGKNGELWIAPEQQKKISVIFQPDNPTLYKNIVRIPHNDPVLKESDGLNPFPVRICGGGISPNLVVLPDQLDFGVVPVNGQQTLDVTLANRGAAPSDVLSVTLSPDTDVSVFILNLDPDNDLQNNVPKVLGSFEEVRVALSCNPKERRSYVGALQVETAFNPGLNTITKPIICTGITAEMIVWPSSIDFGQVRVGSCEDREVTISNNGQADLKIENVEVCRTSQGACSFSNEFGMASMVNLPLNVPANGTAQILVEFCPSDTGASQAYLRVEPEEGAGQSWVVPLTGYGVEPSILLEPSSLTWTDVQLPAANVDPQDLTSWRECKQVTLTNSGSMALDFGEITIPSQVTPEFTLENVDDHPNQLPPGGSYTFKVCYLPSSIGNDIGMAVVCTNAANASGSDVRCGLEGMRGHEIPLIANAIDPRLDVFPLTCDLNFGKVQVEGEMSQKTVILRNIGNGSMQISDIRLLTDMPQLGFSIMEIIPDPSTWHDGVYTLTDNEAQDYITINLRYDPEIPGYNQNYLIISHSDKNAACLGEKPGYQSPDMFIKLYGTSETNIPPIAVAKSPAGVPQGQFGSLTTTISVGTIIDLDGTASYDPDDDPGTTQLEDAVVAYQWSSPDTGFTWISGVNTSFAQARFDTAGQYTIKLAVKDTRDAVSAETPISKLTIFVRQAPIADIGQCATGETFVEIEIPRQLCFDGSGSTDDAGPIPANGYTWYVQENWPTGNKIRYDGASTFNFNFLNAGEHRVYLVVTDKDGVASSDVEHAPYVHVSAVANETLRIEMSWQGGGDLNLHYIRPGGMFKSPFDDCWANNQSPNWISPYQCGYPRMQQTSTSGTNGEVESIDHSQGGVFCNTNAGSGAGSPYRLVVEYVKALRTCRVERTNYYDNCSRCGCNCFLCELFNYCCKSCYEDRTVCSDIPANASIKLYVNGGGYPKYVLYNINISRDAVCTSGDENDSCAISDYTREFTLHRLNGQWQSPN